MNSENYLKRHGDACDFIIDDAISFGGLESGPKEIAVWRDLTKEETSLVMDGEINSSIEKKGYIIKVYTQEQYDEEIELIEG